MLQIKNISKKYTTGDFVQTALNNVSLNFRDNEFVAILGPSGSGKTTLLNIVGGLDRYDTGDLIINGISTKKYKDKDWDSYRNHTIGFVFQSYNLIPHQSILSNVELALTISGISKKERKERAKQALTDVGLGEQIHKRPNQLSGGQMQRVAIARALVNNPDILLADEPTGALDSDTSVQVMELLKEVAKDKLVIMVTHNPELANLYANRIVRVKDGHILDDSNPFELNDKKIAPPEHKNMGKSSMSFLTSLALSFNNLKTKKGRTFLTAFAGSIGIIGIALILSLSTGVNQYITDIQKDTMTSYPITIEQKTFDLSSMMNAGEQASKKKVNHKLNAVFSNGTDIMMTSKMATSISENNLTEFKKYLDNKDSEINNYVGENGIVYSYDVPFSVFSYDSDNTLVNTNGSTFSNSNSNTSSIAQMNGSMSVSMNADMSTSMSTDMMTGNMNSSPFTEMLSGKNDELVSNVIKDNYKVVYGDWPKAYDEVVLVLDKNNEVSLTTLYYLGLLPSKDYKDILKQINKGEEVNPETSKISYEDICNHNFYLIADSDLYQKNKSDLFKYVGNDNNKVEELLKSGITLKVSGIIRQTSDDSSNIQISGSVGYTKALTNYLINYGNKSDIVKAQKNSPDVNVLNGLHFNPDNDSIKIDDAKTYLSNLSTSDKANMWKSMAMTAYADSPEQIQMLDSMTETQLAAMLDSYLENPKDEEMLSIYDNYIDVGSYDDNMKNFGYLSLGAPSSISIYADTFEDKDSISDCIDKYNKDVKDDKDKITYTDYVALLMSSITTIINVITYVLIAFVAVSLIVSSIMIGIITYISVLERTKEIGILRAIGASKKNISQVFNAETFIIGLFSGMIGIGITCLLLLPINAIIHAVTDSTNVNAFLPVQSGIILIVLSVILTLIGGFIPAKKAAKKDPVAALRSE